VDVLIKLNIPSHRIRV